MHPRTAEAFQRIDAAVFNGDTFDDPDDRAELLSFLDRWTTRIAEPSLEIEKLLTLSTNHVSKATSDELPDSPEDVGRVKCTWWPSFARSVGWLFCVPASQDLFDDCYAKAPKDLQDVLAFARSQGCVWVLFDADGPVVEGLYKYEW